MLLQTPLFSRWSLPLTYISLWKGRIICFHRILSHQDTEQWQQLALKLNNVVDLHHLDADPDTAYHPDADSNCYLMPIQIRLFTLMRIRDPDPDPSFQIMAQNLAKC
jgi:hypothetical protein